MTVQTNPWSDPASRASGASRCEFEAREVQGAFAAAAIHLYGRLWWELEQLLEWMVGPDARSEREFSQRLSTFRLELVLLSDACEGSRWRSLLRPDDRRSLRTTLEGLLDLLAVPATSLAPRTLELAQDWLFDAVLDQCAAAEAMAA
jgi:hypothetical protein